MDKLQTSTTTALQSGFTPDQVKLIKSQIMGGKGTDNELAFFLHICKETSLNPFTRQIYFVMRWDSNQQKEVGQVQVSIDGLRTIAERSSEYRGQTKPEWCGDDGVWVDVWLKKIPPTAARVGIYRKDFIEAIYAVARYDAYAARKKDGTPTAMWAKMPDVMLSKCAESLALRKAFPQDLSGLYSGEEMEQADNAVIKQTMPVPKPAPLPDPPPIIVVEVVDDLKDRLLSCQTSEELKDIVEAECPKGSAMRMQYSDVIRKKLDELTIQAQQKAKPVAEVKPEMSQEEFVKSLYTRIDTITSRTTKGKLTSLMNDITVVLSEGEDIAVYNAFFNRLREQKHFDFIEENDLYESIS